ncbi:MAG TPA: protein-glutamate O-methyltransferase CheR [Acidimicrobiales bacterium]|nr:protein-glutamate O-methyltransferase CheR [Acidimicrobiales bacterium]
MAAYIAARAGVSVSGARHPELLARVEQAMVAAGIPSAERFCERLDQDSASFDRLVVALTVPESYFFRESPQIELLASEVLPERAEARGPEGTLRLWSAACASGQEAYTLAILLDEKGLSGRARVLATDLSLQALETARRGVYAKWSLRAVDDRRRRTYFRAVPGGYRVEPGLDRLVTFQHHNLLDDSKDPRMADMDVVLCRNVLVYLTPDAVQDVGRRLAASLAPGGWLLTAATDPHLDAVEGLQATMTPAGVAYRRVVGASPAVVVSTRPQPPPRSRPQRKPRSRPQPQKTVRPKASVAELESETAEAYVVLVRALGSAGRLEAAAEAAAEAVARYPLHVELRLLQGMVLLESGRPDEAAAAAKAALYVEPDLAMAHLTLARADQARQDPAAARRSYRNALAVLEAVPADKPVRLADGETAGRLAGLARAGQSAGQQVAARMAGS